jgi:D-amino peptidase
MEGAFGIWRMRQCRTGTAEWEYGRACLTADVNHVVDGAFMGGARRVTVKDTHDTGFNCLVHKLDPRARYIGGHYTTPTFFGDVSDYDLALYVAIHAASGTEDAFFPHTHFGIFSEIRINGERASEMDVYGGYLGEHGVPIGFVSGEAIAVEQALKTLPWAKSVPVDKGKDAYFGPDAADYLAKGRARLREAAAEACRDAATMRPLTRQGPFHFEAEFRTVELARKFNTWDLPRDDRTVTWSANNMVEGFNILNKLTFFPKKTYPIRRQMLWATRTYFRTRHTYFSQAPNAEGATVP